MAHLDIYLGNHHSFGWEGGPSWRTTVVPLRNKRTRRNGAWSQPRHLFTLPFTDRFPDHYRLVLDTHIVCRGRLHAFRVRNQLDYIASGQVFGEGDGTTTVFQLGRLITRGSQSVFMEIHALSIANDAPTPQVFVNGVAATATFNNRTGVVTFAAPPANDAVLTWSGYFDVWVRFAHDDLPFSIDNKVGFGWVVNGQAELEEAEPPTS